jgi:hypothetical protein
MRLMSFKHARPSQERGRAYSRRKCINTDPSILINIAQLQKTKGAVGCFAAFRNRLPLSEGLIEPWDSSPLSAPGLVGMLWGETGKDFDVALGCLHSPGATRAPHAICRFWT